MQADDDYLSNSGEIEEENTTEDVVEQDEDVDENSDTHSEDTYDRESRAMYDDSIQRAAESIGRR